MTEREKKDYYRNRVERDLKGNPQAPNYRKPKRAARFGPPTKEDKKRLKFLDSYGNPLPGYKWSGRDIVDDKGKIVYKAPKGKVATGTEVQTIKTHGIRRTT